MAVGVILSRQRSGTSSLNSVLDRHPSITSCSEILYPPAWHRPEMAFYPWMERNAAVIKTSQDLCDNFSRYLDVLMQEKQTYILDLKINTLGAFAPSTWSSLYLPWTLCEVVERRISIIYLTRKSKFEIYVSGQVAVANQNWHRVWGQAANDKRVLIDKVELEHFITTCELEDQALTRLLGQYGRMRTIKYEEMFNRDGEIDRGVMLTCFGLLNLTDDGQISYKPDFDKAHRRELSEVVINFDEVAYLATR